MIEKAVELISALGSEALSISALARESGINRSTVYYHFESRDVLIEAVKAWSAEQMSDGFRAEGGNEGKVAQSMRFVLSNPEVMKLWIDEYIGDGDIRDRYPLWDDFVTAVESLTRSQVSGPAPDPEALSVIVLSGGLVGSRVFHRSVRPDLPAVEAVERLAAALNWILRRCGLS